MKKKTKNMALVLFAVGDNTHLLSIKMKIINYEYK